VTTVSRPVSFEIETATSHMRYWVYIWLAA
jgi:hypothetical protein